LFDDVVNVLGLLGAEEFVALFLGGVREGEGRA
jgi:hypothetical protein